MQTAALLASVFETEGKFVARHWLGWGGLYYCLKVVLLLLAVVCWGVGLGREGGVYILESIIKDAAAGKCNLCQIY